MDKTIVFKTGYGSNENIAPTANCYLELFFPYRIPFPLLYRNGKPFNFAAVNPAREKSTSNADFRPFTQGAKAANFVASTKR